MSDRKDGGEAPPEPLPTMAQAWADMVDRRNRPDALDGLDKGIASYVGILWSFGVETFQSCEGVGRTHEDGRPHAHAEPTIEFHGNTGEAIRALGIALQHALPVAELRRVWSIQDGVPTGPHWAMTFTRRADA